MSALISWIRKRFAKVRPLPAGHLHYQSPPGDEPAYRLHLRLHQDGSGLLIVNASTVLHLNPTAAEYAYHLMKGTPPEEVAKQFSRRYRVNRETALRDFSDFRDRIQTLIHIPDLDPVTFLDFERVAPRSASLTAPLRLDCALTYRLPPGTQAEYAPVKRVERELSTEEWKTILDKAWMHGIPHVTFTGGEPTLREDLPELIAHAESRGMVAGLLTDGLRLADRSYLQILLQTGLDHILFLLQAENKASWKALETVMPEDIFVTVHLTVTPRNAEKAGETLERLARQQVRSLSLSASETSLKDDLLILRNRAAELGLTLRWDLPVPYSAQNPATLEVVDEELPPGAGRVWLYLEPDGDVLPAQGEPDKVLGNFLKDPWEKIYPYGQAI
ncbi:MAG: radical SAM protein [Anaerolineales bacterium]|nr:radical SAM protein [Anaerolineales bacterium]MCX7609516.1 radical SAM protein [Anaerolineales bacterium]